jgi:hypothetical protein
LDAGTGEERGCKISDASNPDLISRATVQPCCTETMNVTLKLPDHLCRAARHRTVDESKSLSSWMASLLERELAVPKEALPKAGTLIRTSGKFDHVTGIWKGRMSTNEIMNLTRGE